MSGNGSSNRTAAQTPLYTIKWPKTDTHATKSASGVLVESNLRGQVAMHIYNEVRELESQVEYNKDGSRASSARSVTYVREIVETFLIRQQHQLRVHDVQTIRGKCRSGIE